MNPLAAISKNLRELESAYGKIRTDETREKANSAINSVMDRIQPPRVELREVTFPSIAPLVEEFMAPVATVTLGADQNAPASVSVGSAYVSKETWKDGVTTVYPAGYEEPVVEGDVNGTSGTFYTETVTSVPEPQWIGGWPEYAFVEVVGLFPNRRSLKGTIGDGRTVHVERRMDWKPGRIKGRLVRAGAAPLYRTI